MAIKFVNLHENLEGYARLAGLPIPDKNAAHLYTDGSYSAEKEQAGYGAYLQHNGKFYCWGGEITDGVIISRYEHEAMLKGLKFARSVGATSINVYIDCKCLYDELISRKTEWAREVIPLLDQCNVFLIFSHIGVYGNEMADELSRLYLNGLPADGFYMEANDYRVFSVKRVAANLEEILGRIRKSKKTVEASNHIKHKEPPDEDATKAPPKTIFVHAENIKKPHHEQMKKPSKTAKPAPNSEYIELVHPIHKGKYEVKRTLYNSIKKQREMEIEKKGMKRKTVKDSYIAQEIHRRECARAKSQKKKAA